jgi:hypothetical protein
MNNVAVHCMKTNVCKITVLFNSIWRASVAAIEWQLDIPYIYICNPWLYPFHRAHKISLTPPLFYCSVCTKPGIWTTMYSCFRRIGFVCFYDFDIWSRNSMCYVFTFIFDLGIVPTVCYVFTFIFDFGIVPTVCYVFTFIFNFGIVPIVWYLFTFHYII